jgi:hypothetical protein
MVVAIGVGAVGGVVLRPSGTGVSDGPLETVAVGSGPVGPADVEAVVVSGVGAVDGDEAVGAVGPQPVRRPAAPRSRTAGRRPLD